MNLEKIKQDLDGFRTGEFDRKHNFRELLVSRFHIDDLQGLIDQGFCAMPASVNYHGAYTGALFDHSYAVAMILQQLTFELGLKWEKEDSPIIVGMCHDFCKIDKYQQGVKLTTLRDTNNNILDCAEQKTSIWDYRDPNEVFPIKGHGARSVILVQKYIKLTDEELLCIYHHMGAYEKDDWNEYDQAIKQYPNVLWVHTADMIASKVLGV